METRLFVRYLREHKNPKKIEGMENYMRNKFSFLGIQSVERRELSREYLKGLRKSTRKRSTDDSSKSDVVDWEAVFFLWDQPEREFQYVASDYVKSVERYLVLDDLKNLEQLILKKSWWDTIDALSKTIGCLVLQEPLLIETMLAWSTSDNLWIRRVAILHQLGFKEKTNVDLLAEIILQNATQDEFFIQKAIGWALREYVKTDEKWVVDFVTTHQSILSPLSYKEATKNISRY